MKRCTSCNKEIFEGLPFCPHCGAKQKEIDIDDTFKGEDPYKILQISRDADIEIIEAAYRCLAKKYHPDSGNGPDEEIIKKINWAYSLLRDEDKRNKWNEEYPQSDNRGSESVFEQTEQVKSNGRPRENNPPQREKHGFIKIAFVVLLALCVFFIISFKNYYQYFNIYYQAYDRTIREYTKQKSNVDLLNQKVSTLNSNNKLLQSTVTAMNETINTQRSKLLGYGEPYFMNTGIINTNPNDDYIDSYCTNNNYKNFIADVSFTNPYKATNNNMWDYGVLFRDTGNNNDLRFVIDSTRGWALINGILKPTKQGTSKSINVVENGQNKIKIVALNEWAYFFINDIFIDAIDVSAEQKIGRFCLGAGFYIGDNLQGKSVKYFNLQVSPITVSN
jgi:hypothetical protein